MREITVVYFKVCGEGKYRKHIVHTDNIAKQFNFECEGANPN